MALQGFVDGGIPTIKAAWLNLIDAFYISLFQGATTVEEAVAALELETAAKTDENQVWTASQAGEYDPLLTVDGHISPDFSKPNFVTVLTANAQLDTPTNVVPGMSFAIEIHQHAAAAKLLTYTAFYRKADGGDLTISTTLSSENLLTGIVNSAGTGATCVMNKKVGA